MRPAPIQMLSAPLPPRLRLARWLGHQRWIPKGQDFIVRRLCPPDAPPALDFEVGFYGLRYRGTLANFLDWTVFFYGAYCAAELVLLSHAARCLRAAGQPVVYLDVGANVGHHLLFMSKRVDQAYGFEPWKPVFDRAVEKLQLNHCVNARVFPLALGERNASLRFFPPCGPNQGTGSLVQSWSSGGNADQGAPITVKVSAGDELIAAEQIGKVGIIKIDVEGYEAAVCRGMAQTLLRCRPFVLLELSPQGVRELGSGQRFKSSFYPDALIFRLRNRRHSFRLEPYCFGEGLAELFIVPAEQGAALERALGGRRWRRWLSQDSI
jgi:FkbM family methyltransferase